MLSALPAMAQEYENGMAALNRGNQVLAERWFKIAAEKDHVAAQFELARIYDEGHGARQNYKVAFYWYERAAVAGHVEAASVLGIFYEEGKGIKKDLLKAYIWYRVAAGQNTFAEFSRGFLEDQLSEAERREGERRAAELMAEQRQRVMTAQKPEKSARVTPERLEAIAPAAGGLIDALERIVPAGNAPIRRR